MYGHGLQKQSRKRDWVAQNLTSTFKKTAVDEGVFNHGWTGHPSRQSCIPNPSYSLFVLLYNAVRPTEVGMAHYLVYWHESDFIRVWNRERRKTRMYIRGSLHLVINFRSSDCNLVNDIWDSIDTCKHDSIHRRGRSLIRYKIEGNIQAPRTSRSYRSVGAWS